MSSSPDTWILVAPEQALPALDPLIQAHKRKRPVRLLSPEDENLKEYLQNAAGVLKVGDRRHTPRTAHPAPFLVSPNGRRIPAGWLPLTGAGELACFAKAAAEVQSRTGKGGPVVLLGQWDDHVERTVKRSLKILSGDKGVPPVPVYNWTADRLIRRDLLSALRIGLGVAIYCGHGRPYGWAGYHGLHSRHLIYAKGRPSGAILSLTCDTANRYNVGLTFAEVIPLNGIAAASFSAVKPTKTVDNWYWGTSICEILSSQPECSVGELILQACPSDVQWDVYRIIGDPLAPLQGVRNAEEECSKIWAPAPDESPVPPGYLEDLSQFHL